MRISQDRQPRAYDGRWDRRAATAYAAIQGLPYFAVLALPFLFSGGMMLFDTLDGAFMNFAYGWAFARPVRKVYWPAEPSLNPVIVPSTARS